MSWLRVVATGQESRQGRCHRRGHHRAVQCRKLQSHLHGPYRQRRQELGAWPSHRRLD